MTIEHGDGSPGHRLYHRAVTYPTFIMIGRYRQLRDQGHATARRHHVAQGLETGTLEALILANPTGKTETHRLIPQAVAIFQHQQFLALEIAERYLSGLGLRWWLGTANHIGSW